MTRWQIVLGLEAIALMIALVMPITPSKTGSDWSFAHLFFADPSYAQEVMVGFVFMNILLALLAIGFLAWRRFGEGE